MAASLLPVTDCGDSGAGTLRDVIGNASSGDTVDLSSLVCMPSQISLTSGEIEVKQDDLTIKGPGPAALVVDGSLLPAGPSADDNRLFKHTGGGTLTFQDIGLANGHVDHDTVGVEAKGGCVYSDSNLAFYNSTVVSCSAYSAGKEAFGGAIFASGNVTMHDSAVDAGAASSGDYNVYGGGIWAKGDIELIHSNVTGSSAESKNGNSYGGGIFANGDLTLSYATISGNTMTAAKIARGGGAYVSGGLKAEYCTVSGNSAYSGGGIFGRGDMGMTRCTVSGNHADAARGGGIAATADAGNANTVDIRSSTISGNSAYYVGGLLSDAASVSIYNSTIAFNEAATANVGGTYAPGVALSAYWNAVSALLQSTLVSNNTYGSTELDLSAYATMAHPLAFNPGPANNFVRAYATNVTFPDSNTKACPLLGPLRDNGGPTWTHALLSGSEAIDVGNNVLGDDEDQRGVPMDSKPFAYPRESPTSLPDIGAYEVNQDDIAFNSGFEGCPDL